MATTHVFIVDTNTLKYHLEYLFAGTGAKEEIVDFNNHPYSNLNPATEKNLVSMMADSQRVRVGDLVIFYLQQSYREKVYEGKFYGIFQVRDAPSFLDNNDGNQFLKEELKKSLTFRVLIQPYQVYAEGITEWEALDEIKNLNSPNQMLWSLIYRKLKGNRGNCMITLYESERLISLIQHKNNGRYLSGNAFTYNSATQTIEVIHSIRNYTGRQEVINILPRLIHKYRNFQQFEGHLQCYIVQNIGLKNNESLNDTLLGGWEVEWIGNEVSCGVGMQRIDLLLSVTNKQQRLCIPIELKSVEADLDNNLKQLQRYIDWIKQYYIPNIQSKIEPVLIVKKSDKEQHNFFNKIKEFNQFNPDCYPLKIINYEIKDDDLLFTVKRT